MLHRNVLQGISADSSPEEQALYCNLSLLGITAQAAKHNIEVARTSFRKPNPRGLELVLFYLYAAICGEARALKVRCALLWHAYVLPCEGCIGVVLLTGAFRLDAGVQGHVPHP